MRKVFGLLLVYILLAYSYVKADSVNMNNINKNQVVAIINGKEKTMQDVYHLFYMLPSKLRDVSFFKLFPMLRTQVISSVLLKEAVFSSNIELDPEVQKILEEVKVNTLVEILVSKIIKTKLNDDYLKLAYKKYIREFPKDKKEVGISHILVKTENDAKDILNYLQNGYNFDILAKQYSIDVISSDRGGDIGYFQENEGMFLPEFSKVIFSLFVGGVSQPLKTDMGWHIIKKVDERHIMPKTFHEIKSSLTQILSQEIIEKYIQYLRTTADIRVFDIKGIKSEDTFPYSLDNNI